MNDAGQLDAHAFGYLGVVLKRPRRHDHTVRTGPETRLRGGHARRPDHQLGHLGAGRWCVPAARRGKIRRVCRAIGPRREHRRLKRGDRVTPDRVQE